MRNVVDKTYKVDDDDRADDVLDGTHSDTSRLGNSYWMLIR